MNTYDLENPTSRTNFYEKQKYRAMIDFNAEFGDWLNFSFNLLEEKLDQLEIVWEEQNIVDDLEEARTQTEEALLSAWEEWRVEMLLDEAYQSSAGEEVSISIGDEWRDGDIVIDPPDFQIIVLGEDEFAYRLRTYSVNTDWELGDADDVMSSVYNLIYHLLTNNQEKILEHPEAFYRH